MIEYRIDIADANAHRYRVTLSIRQPTWPVTVSLPVWIPGSYMVREFARHVQGLQARVGRHALDVRALDKASWVIDVDLALARVGNAPSSRAVLTLTYEVYAFDPSVRAAFLDAQRGFFNGTSLFLRVHGREAQPHAVSFGKLPRGWRIATAMPSVLATSFIAADYDEAVDHPFELGTFWQGTFTARGVPHTFVVAGAWPDFDSERLLRDSQRVCETQLDFWHGNAAEPAKRRDVPFRRYVFMLHAVDDGYGGLEHRASTALVASRADLPRRSAAEAKGDGYITLLGLISHEYFHTWNVKRLKPVELTSIDYTRENPTELLWFFEGFTSYYDDLLLRRSGLIDDAQYLKLLAKQVNSVQATPGRHVQSVAQASFDAWIKYYRADENTPNATVSYYAKGALVALAFDLSLRTESSGSLDDVMRLLWQRASDAAGTAGKRRGHAAGRPVDEALIAAALQTIRGRSMARELAAWVHGTDDAPWLALLDRMGVANRQDAATSLAAMLGLRISEGPVSGVQIKSVLNGGLGARAGLAAGDEILAVDGWRVRKLDEALAWWRTGAAFDLTLVRRQRLLTLHVPASAVAPTSCTLSMAERSDGATQRRRQRWLTSA